jgi:hypothetical protein
LLLIEYLQSPESHLFDEVDRFEVAGADVDQMIMDVSGTAACLAHLKKFDMVGRKFGDFHSLVPAMKLAQSSGSHVSEDVRLAVIEYLERDDSQLFAESFAVMGQDLDDLIHATRGLQLLLGHLRGLDNAGRQFDSFHELVAAVQVAVNAGGYTDPKADALPTPVATISQPERETLIALMVAPLHPLFTPSLEVITDDQVGAFVKESGGMKKATEHVHNFFQVGRGFKTFADLLAAVRQAVLPGGSHVSRAMRAELLEYIQGDECHLFVGATENIKVLGADLDALMAEGGGLEEVLNHLRKFNQAGRFFESFGDLAPAIGAAVEAGSYLDQETREALLAYLSETSLLTPRGGGSGALRNEDLDVLARAAGGGEALRERLKGYHYFGRRFDSAAELQAALADTQRTSLYAAAEDLDGLLAWLRRPNKPFLAADVAAKVGRKEVETVLRAWAKGSRRGRGWAGLKDDLFAKFERTGRQFAGVPELVDAVRAYVLRSEVVSKTMCDRLVAYLSDESPDGGKRLFSQSFKCPRRELDDLLVKGGGVEETIRRMTNLAADGQQFAHLCDMTTAVENMAEVPHEPEAGLSIAPGASR